jgi:hypothetical protein
LGLGVNIIKLFCSSLTKLDNLFLAGLSKLVRYLRVRVVEYNTQEHIPSVDSMPYFQRLGRQERLASNPYFQIFHLGRKACHKKHFNYWWQCFTSIRWLHNFFLCLRQRVMMSLSVCPWKVYLVTNAPAHFAFTSVTKKRKL